MSTSSFGNRHYYMPQSLASEQAMRSLKDLRKLEVDNGTAVDYCAIPIHDEFVVEPTENHTRRILSRLARLMQPALPPPPAGDPVARFLLSTYGTPSTGGAK